MYGITTLILIYVEKYGYWLLNAIPFLFLMIKLLFFAISVQTAILRYDSMYPSFHSESFGEEAHNTRKKVSVCFKRKGSTKQTQSSILR